MAKEKIKKKGRITKKGQQLLQKQLEKIQAQKQQEMAEIIASTSKQERRQRKQAEKIRKKLIAYFERQTLLAAVANMNLSLKKGSPEKLATRAALDAAIAKEESIKSMSWKEILEKYQHGEFAEVHDIYDDDNDDDCCDYDATSLTNLKEA